MLFRSVHSAYKKLSDEEKKKKIQNFTNKARLNARAEMVQILVQDLQEDELLDELARLKEGGFLTKSVLEKWKELFR